MLQNKNRRRESGYFFFSDVKSRDVQSIPRGRGDRVTCRHCEQWSLDSHLLSWPRVVLRRDHELAMNLDCPINLVADVPDAGQAASSSPVKISNSLAEAASPKPASQLQEVGMSAGEAVSQAVLVNQRGH